MLDLLQRANGAHVCTLAAATLLGDFSEEGRREGGAPSAAVRHSLPRHVAAWTSTVTRAQRSADNKRTAADGAAGRPRSGDVTS